MNEFCADVLGKARKAHSRVLQVMQKAGKGGELANLLGVSDSTVSRMKTEQLEINIALIYGLGFKVVSEGEVTVDRDELCVLRRFYSRVTQSTEALEAIAE
jgi:tRNA(Phe) wybutosine-synthesizing methylase Tyw3